MQHELTKHKLTFHNIIMLCGKLKAILSIIVQCLKSSDPTVTFTIEIISVLPIDLTIFGEWRIGVGSLHVLSEGLLLSRGRITFRIY